MALQPKPKRRRRKRRRAARSRRGGAQNPPQPAPRRIRPANVLSGTVNSAGEMRIRRTDYLKDVTGAADKQIFSSVLFAGAIPWLKRIADVYAKSIWHSCKLIYKPAVGTTVDGQVVIGIDFDSKTSAKAPGDVYSLSPLVTTPVWCGAEIQIPARQLMSRREYLHHSVTTGDAGPGHLVIQLPKVAKTYGTLWIQYDIEFRGTENAPAASGNVTSPWPTRSSTPELLSAS